MFEGTPQTPKPEKEKMDYFKALELAKADEQEWATAQIHALEGWLTRNIDESQLDELNEKISADYTLAGLTALGEDKKYKYKAYFSDYDSEEKTLEEYCYRHKIELVYR